MKDQIIASAVAVAGAYLFFISPIMDSRNEQRLSVAYGRETSPAIQLVQISDYDRTNQDELRQQRRQEEFERYIRESAPQEPQYIWSPDGRLQGWQQPDASGNMQQYDMKGQWKGTISQ